MCREKHVLFHFPCEFLCHGPWKSLVRKQVTNEQHCLDADGETTTNGVFQLQLKVCIANLHLLRYQLLSLCLFKVDAFLQGLQQLLLLFL